MRVSTPDSDVLSNHGALTLIGIDIVDPIAPPKHAIREQEQVCVRPAVTDLISELSSSESSVVGCCFCSSRRMLQGELVTCPCHVPSPISLPAALLVCGFFDGRGRSDFANRAWVQVVLTSLLAFQTSLLARATIQFR